MKKSLVFSVLTSILLSVCGVVFAGPDDKEKESVTITHGNSSEGGEGYVEIVVSVSAATSHLTKHESDCATDASDPELLAAMQLLSLGNDCDYNE